MSEQASDDFHEDENVAYAEAVNTLVEGIDGLLEAGATVAEVRAEFEALMRGRS